MSIRVFGKTMNQKDGTSRREKLLRLVFSRIYKTYIRNLVRPFYHWREIASDKTSILPKKPVSQNFSKKLRKQNPMDFLSDVEATASTYRSLTNMTKKFDKYDVPSIRSR